MTWHCGSSTHQELQCVCGQDLAALGLSMHEMRLNSATADSGDLVAYILQLSSGNAPAHLVDVNIHLFQDGATCHAWQKVTHGNSRRESQNIKNCKVSWGSCCARCDRIGSSPIGSNYRRRSAAAQEAVAQARARGTVATAIAARVYQADGIDEACSSCDERKTRQRSAVHRFVSSVVAKSQAKARARRRVPVALRPRRQRPPGASERLPEAEGPPPTPKAQEPKAAGPPAEAGERIYHIGRNLTLVNPTKRPESKEKRREPLRKRANGQGRSQRPKPHQNQKRLRRSPSRNPNRFWRDQRLPYHQLNPRPSQRKKIHQTVSTRTRTRTCGNLKKKKRRSKTPLWITSDGSCSANGAARASSSGTAASSWKRFTQDRAAIPATGKWSAQGAADWGCRDGQISWGLG